MKTDDNGNVDDDHLPAPIQQRASARSPLSLAQSRLDLLITQRQQKNKDHNETKQREVCMDQIVQVRQSR